MNRLPRLVRLVPAVAFAGALLAPRPAHATLTSSEQGQIVSYVAEGRLPTAARVRALVARPDLTADESAQVLVTALAPLTFTDARAAYLHELLYGESSVTSRGVLAVAVTRALGARADGVLSRHEADLDQDPASIAELTRLFAFLDGDVANAGHPHGISHDPNAGIGAQAYDDAAKALATVIEHHARWLKGDAAIPAAAEPVRAQLQLAILDMTNDTTTRRFDAADRLWLTGVRRAPLTESGILLLDDGHTDSARIAAVRGLLARMPGGHEDAEAVAMTPMAVPLRARGDILRSTGNEPTAPFGEEVSAPSFPPEVVSIARALATVTVKHALDIRPELHAQVDQDTGAAGDANGLVTMVMLLALDGPRAMDLALVRAVAGHSESLALLSDALGALAVFTPPTPGGMTIPMGRAPDANAPASVNASNVRLSPAGFATAFSLMGHAWSITREAGKAKATRDGQPATLAMLEHARAPVTAGPVWSSGSVFAKMSGSPRAGVSSDPQAGVRVRLVGDGSIATPAPGDDAAVTATVDVTGEAAIVLRAISTVAAFKGVGLVLDARNTATASLQASLRAWDGTKATDLGPPVPIPCASRCRVEVHVRKGYLGATVQDVELPAVLVPAPFAHGDVALAAKSGGSIDASGWSVTKPAAH
jgi:hypothetical protein